MNYAATAPGKRARYCPKNIAGLESTLSLMFKEEKMEVQCETVRYVLTMVKQQHIEMKIGGMTSPKS